MGKMEQCCQVPMLHPQQPVLDTVEDFFALYHRTKDRLATGSTIPRTDANLFKKR